jgi:hypothetical protein
MAENGRFPDSDLAEIPGGRLCKKAAANWIALRRKGGKELGVWIAPIGPRGSYRTYDEQQYFWNLYQSGKGNLAARPGTSNHGVGNAVDLAAPGSMRQVIDRYGKEYGWYWGEVRSENWHVTHNGQGKAGDDELKNIDNPTLGVGDKGDDVERLQKWLSKHDYDIAVDGQFGPQTKKAVRNLYRAYGHLPHDKFGDAGWSIIEGKHPWRVLFADEREKLADLFELRRRAREKGGWDKLDEKQREKREELKKWLVERRKHIWRNGKKDGWKEHNRGRRYAILKRATPKQK